MAISLIGFYGSSLAHNLMQALAVGVVTAAVFAMPLVILSNLPTVFGIPSWRWGLLKYIEWPTLAFFAFLFITVGAAVETGLIDTLARGLEQLIEASRRDEAKEWLTAGLARATKKGDPHTAGEIESALSTLR